MKKTSQLSTKVKYKILKFIFIPFYFATTLALPIYLLFTCYLSKKSFFYAGIVTFISLILLDIVCTFLEEQIQKIYNRLIKILEKKKKEQEKQLQNLEDWLLDEKDYEKEIECAKISIKNFRKKVQEEANFISPKIFRICNKMEDILKDLKNNPQQYYQLRHTFQAYFPEFQKMTYLFLDICKVNSLDNEIEADYKNMLTEYEKYIDHINSNINTIDKLNLKVGITSLVKIIEAERNRGE